jgi:hypothetical protein
MTLDGADDTERAIWQSLIGQRLEEAGDPSDWERCASARTFLTTRSAELDKALEGAGIRREAFRNLVMVLASRRWRKKS